MKPDKEEIEKTILELLEDMDEDLEIDEDLINAETRIVQDLGLSSIDGLHLFSGLDIHYSIRLPYENLIMISEDEFVTDLSIGQIAEFVHNNFEVQVSKDPNPM